MNSNVLSKRISKVVMATINAMRESISEEASGRRVVLILTCIDNTKVRGPASFRNTHKWVFRGGSGLDLR